jgi:hypothetical protein
MQQHITFDGPILPGSISIARSQCGKPKCACKGQPPCLHGPYYRWTGFVDGKRTTKTISKEAALECKRRILQFRKLQRMVEGLVRDSLSSAPWVPGITKSK